MIPKTVIALANLERRRRGDTAPRAPLAHHLAAQRALAEEGLSADGLTESDLPALARLVKAVSELGNSLAHHEELPISTINVVNKVASGCNATPKLSGQGKAVRSDLDWRDPNPVAGLARRVIQELGEVDTTRLRQCQRIECDLLFFDPTRSRSQRWHAENPCGWLERQHRRRTHL
jgi:hypothetical protein